MRLLSGKLQASKESEMLMQSRLRTVQLSILVSVVILVTSSASCGSGSVKPSTPSDAALRLQYITPEEKPLSPQVNGRGFELLRTKENAWEFSQTANLPDADRDFASFIVARTDRQLDLQANLQTSDRIVNGRRANYQDFNYQVALVYSGYTNASKGFLGCGGALIDVAWVVTAAHCLTAYIQSPDVQIYLGSAKLSQGGTLVPLAANGIYRHSGYNAKTDENDIALLKLASPETGYQPIDLATTMLEPGMIGFTRIAIISGWGDAQYGARSGSDDLLYANVPIISHTACQTDYSKLPPDKIREIKDGMLCAGNGWADACQGDSGGPLVLRTTDGKNHLEGIVDFGEGCAEKDFPGVYTRIPSYVPWIKSCMAGACQPNVLPPPGPL
jgi:secreted trypsin-like serine protease